MSTEMKWLRTGHNGLLWIRRRTSGFLKRWALFDQLFRKDAVPFGRTIHATCPTNRTLHYVITLNNTEWYTLQVHKLLQNFPTSTMGKYEGIDKDNSPQVSLVHEWIRPAYERSCKTIANQPSLLGNNARLVKLCSPHGRKASTPFWKLLNLLFRFLLFILFYIPVFLRVLNVMARPSKGRS